MKCELAVKWLIYGSEPLLDVFSGAMIFNGTLLDF